MPSATIHYLCTYSRRLGFWFAVTGLAWGAERTVFTLEGHLSPAPRFSYISVTGGQNSYSAAAPVYWDGKFKFKKLPRGTYNVVVSVPRMGEFRQTYSVGAGTADKKGRVQLTITIHPSRAARLYTARDRFTVPVRRLSIPQKARQELLNAQRRLQKKDLDGAVKHVDKALEMAPQYAAAWNMLGTIDYQRREFTKAEEHFREAKAQDPDMFEPVVNLGGVLLNLGKFDEALEFNLDAVKRRPKDALANAQLGMTYVELKQPLMGIKHLEETKRLDPGHYTYPQLHLSEIYWKLGNRMASVAEMEHFLRYHPDHEQAEKLRQTIRQVRERQGNPTR